MSSKKRTEAASAPLEQDEKVEKVEKTKQAGQAEKVEQEYVEVLKSDFDKLTNRAQAQKAELSTLRKEFEAQKAELDALKKEATAQKQRGDEMTTQAQRLQAEFDNYRKRTNETNKRVRVDGNVEVLEKILPVLDAIEQAKSMIKDENTLGGLKIISRQLGELLGGFGVELIDSLGKDFDPNLHNAVMEADAPDEQKGKVVQVYQQGYKIGDRILRHAVVIVGK